jgi:preprotein translocase subunit SecD
MSPPARTQSRRPRALVVSLILVVGVAFGSLAGVLGARWTPRLGLDLAGGFSVVYKPAHKTTLANLNEAVNILTNRVNGLGVSGAEVNTQGDEIVVSVPDVKNPNAVLSVIGQTAQLLFRPALCEAPPYVQATETKNGQATETKNGQKAHKVVSPGPLPSTCPQANLIIQSNIVGNIASSNGNPYPNALDATLEAYPSTTSAQDANDHSKTVLLPGLPGSGGVRYLAGPAELTGHIVKSALAQLTTTQGWVVNMSLTKDGSKAWDTMAEKYFHEIIVIELDGVVQSAPLTLPQSASFTSFGGQVQISGSFTQASAKNLAVALNYGTLPVRLVQLTTQTVSPTLGRSSLDAGLGAGIAGLILVLLYTIFYYRLLGIVVVSGLAVTGALLWSIISALGHTSAAPSFDLAGVTGIIVSIGITVDSYIVYFERLKDETRAGRTVRTSLDRGFRSAFRTVLAADFVSLLAAVLLYWLAVGEVKGFAFFLGLSTLLDVFITYFFTRPLVFLLGRSERLTRARGIGINRGLAVQAGTES